jgi:hypothetical protein
MCMNLSLNIALAPACVGEQTGITIPKRQALEIIKVT